MLSPFAVHSTLSKTQSVPHAKVSEVPDRSFESQDDPSPSMQDEGLDAETDRLCMALVRLSARTHSAYRLPLLLPVQNRTMCKFLNWKHDRYHIFHS